MATVKFTSHLYRYFPGLSETEVNGATIAEIIHTLDERFPGLASYIMDEQGRLRKHVNIFIGEDMITDRETLQDAVTPESRVFVFQALSGGSFGG